MACSIEVPVAWFEAGATLQIQLPRLLTCARCEGGGCDACGRRGAFEQQAAGIASEVAVVLPRQPAGSCAPVKLRLPSLGARAPRSARDGAARSAVPAAQPAPVAEATELQAVALEAAPEPGGGALALPMTAALALPLAGAHAAPPVAAPPPAAAPPAEQGEEPGEPGEQRELPPGHLLLTVIPRAPDPAWAPPGNVQALMPAPEPRSFWAWRQPLELLLFPDRLAAALGAWWQARAPGALRSRPVWFWAALAVVVTFLSLWLLTRSGSRSQ